MRPFGVFLITILFSFSLFAQSEKEAEMEKIRNDNRYRWGEALSSSQDEAREKAREDLLSKFKTVVVSESVMVNDEFSNTTSALTVGSIQNLREIIARRNNQYLVMVYVSDSDLKAAENERKELIRELLDNGISQEEQLNISDALKYYSWAYRLLSTYQDDVRIEVNGTGKKAKNWLATHIPSMLSKISIRIPEERIEENPDDYDRYILNIEATYNGSPVSALDIAYFNGDRLVSPVHCKSGEAALQFHDVSTMKDVSIRILYEYPQEGANYSPIIQSVYPKGYKKMIWDDRASLRVPFKLNKMIVKRAESVPEVKAGVLTGKMSGEKADAEAIVKEPRKTIERQYCEKANEFIDRMKRVETAIRKKNYESVRSDFTDEGFRIFELMMGSGAVSVVKTHFPYTVEQSGNYIVGKAIPLGVKTGKHISRENMVFRFDYLTGKIKSVAYALTERAENDIFREASWSMNSRYALMQFMEDYQTAYALKRIDYIESIFSDKAIIITGTMNPKAKKRFYGPDEVKGVSFENKVTYKKYNKGTFIERLKEDFRKKSYIQLVFEDTYISKVANIEGLVDNDVIWVELNQAYNSNTYSDRGYLALQINLRPVASEINVRTWTPYFIPIDKLKEAFPIGLQ